MVGLFLNMLGVTLQALSVTMAALSGNTCITILRVAGLT